MNQLNAKYADKLISDAKTAISQTSIYKLVGIKSRMITLRQDLYHDLPASISIRAGLLAWIDKINHKITGLNRRQVEAILNKCDNALEHAQQTFDHPDPRDYPYRLAHSIVEDADIVLNSLRRIAKTRYLAFVLREKELSHRAFAIETKAQMLKNMDNLKPKIQRTQEAILKKEAAERQRREEEERQTALRLAEEYRQHFNLQITQAQVIKRQLDQALTISNYNLARTLLHRLQAFDPNVLANNFYPQDASMQIRRYQDQVRALARKRANGNKVPVL